MKGGDGQAATEVRLFLREARPTWRLSQVIMAESKLAKVGINSVSQLLEALSCEGQGSLNELLIAHGEKTFTDETLAALHDHAASSPPPLTIPSKSSKAAPVATAEQEQKREQELRQRFERSRQQKAEVLSKAEAMRARAEAEEQMEDALADLESCKENGWYDAIAEKEMEVERLKAVLVDLAIADDPVLKEKVENQRRVAKEIQEENRQLAALAKEAAETGTASSSAATGYVEQRSTLDTNSGAEWFSVVFKRVFVKKGPSEKAKSWGFVHQGQHIQVLPHRALDERGREWVELTFFELFRSCLRGRKDRDPQKVTDDERRGFCLIDAAELGALLAGPLPRSQWPEVEHADAEEFCCWSGEAIEDIIPSLKVPTVESKATQQFKSVRQLHVHEKPSLDSPHLGKKPPGTIIYAEKGVFHGWVKLAGEPGWVLFDITMDTSAASKARAAKATEEKMVRDAAHFQRGINPEFLDAMKKDDELRLRDLLDKYDEVPLEALKLQVDRVRAFAGETSLVRLGVQKLAELEHDGESGRIARKLRGQLETAQTEKELREIIKACENANASAVALEARCALSQHLEEQAQSRLEHGHALQDLVAAIKTGNAAAIKSARDAARAAGVPKKELARVFALAQEG